MISTDDQKTLTKMILNLFEHWKLSTQDQLILLGLSPNSKNSLYRYKAGTSVPSPKRSQERMGYLLAIHKNLRLMYPQNPNICYTWVHQKNKMLENKKPLTILTEEGLSGMKTVLAALNFMVGH